MLIILVLVGKHRRMIDEGGACSWGPEESWAELSEGADEWRTAHRRCEPASKEGICPVLYDSAYNEYEMADSGGSKAESVLILLLFALYSELSISELSSPENGIVPCCGE